MHYTHWCTTQKTVKFTVEISKTVLFSLSLVEYSIFLRSEYILKNKLLIIKASFDKLNTLWAKEQPFKEMSKFKWCFLFNLSSKSSASPLTFPSYIWNTILFSQWLASLSGDGFWRSGEFPEWTRFPAEERIQSVPAADCVISKTAVNRTTTSLQGQCAG